MSRSRSRARKRQAVLGQLRAEFNRVRDDPEAFFKLLNEHSRKDVAIWPLAAAADAIKPLEDDERAMIAEAVAPWLVRLTPGTVKFGEAVGQPVSTSK